MSEENRPEVGTIVWTDLTVPDAEEVRRFYEAVVGWKPHAVEMGGYDDWAMVPPGGEHGVAGVCHARGSNANLPPQWLVYVAVDDVRASADRCVELGGELVDGPRPMAGKSFCVVRDPAGAVLALIER